MRRDVFSFVAVCACALLLSIGLETKAQNYTYTPWRQTDSLPNGEPRPMDFMTLGDANHTYVRKAYGSYQDYGQTNGAYNQGNPISHSHYIYDRSNTNNGTMLDPCECFNVAPPGQPANYVHEKILPPSWSGVLGEVQDKVVRLGCYNLSETQCKKAQEIEYWFYPPKDSSTLLVYFSFCQEKGAHPAASNPRFYIEVLDAQTGNVIPSGSYKRCNGTTNTSWPYNKFLAVPSGTDSNNDSYCADETGVTEGTWYWAFPEATPTNFDYHICPSNQTSGYAHSENDVQWFQYKPLAFDLKSYADSGQTNAKSVKLRMRVRSCTSQYHWAYAYYAAKLMPGYISVDACGQESINLSVPWGFFENSYEWHYGKDKNSSNNIIDPASPPPGVSGTIYNLTIDPTVAGARVWPYYRCEMKSYTGVPFTYEAFIKLYKIEPAFTYEQIVDTNYKCSHIIQLIDTGKVYELTPKDNGQDYDTTSQTPLKEIKWYYKNRVGEYREIPGSSGKDTCKFNVTNTPDIDLTNFNYGPGGDSIMIKLVMQDSLKKCIDSIEMKIGLDSTFVQPGTKDTTVRICSNQLPYFYQPEKYGQTYRWDYAGTKECHVGNDFEDWSWNYCDSIVKVTLEVMTPRVEIKDLGDYCDSFRTTLTVIPAPNQTFNQEDIQVLNWNGDEYSTGITYPVDHAGVYTVDVSIGAGCVTSASYKVAACMPFMNLPGSITPSNHDGINDCFEIPQKDLVQSLEFTVYNRNGTVVFHTKDVNFKWRGARFSEDYPEKELVNQTYVYTLKMVDYNGKPYPVMKGVILVL